MRYGKSGIPWTHSHVRRPIRDLQVLANLVTYKELNIDRNYERLKSFQRALRQKQKNALLINHWFNVAAGDVETGTARVRILERNVWIELGPPVGRWPAVSQP